MAKPKPLPPEPSLIDIAASLTELHLCLEANNETQVAYQEAMKLHVAGEAEKTTAIWARIQEDRHASKNRDMVLDGRLNGLDKCVEATHKSFLTVEGQLRALSDDKAITDSANHERQDLLAKRVEIVASTMGDNSAALEAIKDRIGVGKETPNILAISPGKLIAGVTAAATVAGGVIAGAVTVFQKIAPLLH